MSIETEKAEVHVRLAQMLDQINNWPHDRDFLEALSAYKSKLSALADNVRGAIYKKEMLDREAEIVVRAQRITQAVWDLYEDAYVYMENRKIWEDLLSTFERVTSRIREELEGVPPRVIMEPERIERRLNEMHKEIHRWCRTPAFYRAVYEFWYALECLWDSGPRCDDEERDCCHENEEERVASIEKREFGPGNPRDHAAEDD